MEAQEGKTREIPKEIDKALDVLLELLNEIRSGKRYGKTGVLLHHRNGELTGGLETVRKWTEP